LKFQKKYKIEAPYGATTTLPNKKFNMIRTRFIIVLKILFLESFKFFVQNPGKLKTSPESFTNSAASVLRKINLKAWQT
jgi:hypothetical protein